MTYLYEMKDMYTDNAIKREEMSRFIQSLPPVSYGTMNAIVNEISKSPELDRRWDLTQIVLLLTTYHLPSDFAQSNRDIQTYASIVFLPKRGSTNFWERKDSNRAISADIDFLVLGNVNAKCSAMWLKLVEDGSIAANWKATLLASTKNPGNDTAR